MRLKLKDPGSPSAQRSSETRRSAKRASRIGHACAIGVLIGSMAPAAMAMDKENWNFWEIVACPSENIEMNGSVRFQAQLVEGSGHATWVFQAFWTGDAWGLSSGSEYILQGKWMEVIQEEPPFVFLWNDHFQLIGKDTAPNYSFYNKIRIIVDANGEPRVDFSGEATPCPTVDFDIWQ